MSAHPAIHGRRLLASALARGEAWLLKPVEPAEPIPAPVELRSRPVVAVVGLAPRCGGTTLARALAGELGRRDGNGAGAVAGQSSEGAIPLAGASTARLARALGALGGASVRTSGRLCLLSAGDLTEIAVATKHLAPLVIDVEHGGAAGVAASLADHVALVSGPSTEPALTAVVAASLARIGPEPLVVLNRVSDSEPWEGRDVHLLPESRAGARLALAGRDPRGEFGGAVTALADRCEMRRADW